MKSLKVSHCPIEKKNCVKWIEAYLKDCVCNVKDGVSFAFGITSLICWGVAEIPQIITNFKNKSGHGVSLSFLSTWIVGDVFNLVGCILEPATLPTQFYTALLYTATTVVLVLQCLYYDYFLQWWKCRHIQVNPPVRGDETKPLNPKTPDPTMTVPRNAPVEVPRRRRDFYYMSARSLAGSDTPPLQSYMKPKSSTPCTMDHPTCSSSEDEATTLVLSSSNPVTLPRTIPSSVVYGTFLAASLNLPFRSNGLIESHKKLLGRRLLQEDGLHHDNVYGQWLGWLMAAIYMGGRIPQIWLNIKRGSVEGLNPLMFIFALIANATYVGSIVVRNTKWEKIRANLPWLLDAIVCVLLDLFIILQYIYYSYIKRDEEIHDSGEYYEDYVEANKVVLS